MYGQIQQKTWSLCNRQLASRAFEFSQVTSLCGAIPIGLKTPGGYVGLPWYQWSKKWRHMHSSKVNDSKRVGKPGKSECCNERVDNIRAYRKDQAGEPLRLQPFCSHSFPAELRHEEIGCLLANLQTDRLHGSECKTGRGANVEKSSQVEAAKKIKFRCPIGEQKSRNLRNLLLWGTNSILKKTGIVDFVPLGNETPVFKYLIVPPRDTYLD